MRLLVQGWRGINHSYAMVNQNQLLELAARQEITLFHQDLPFASPTWNAQDNAAGFAAPRAAQIAAIAPPDGPVDVAYRIGFPYRAHGGPEAKIFCFATCEFRSIDDPFFQPPDGQAIDPRVRFIAPSHWSKNGLANSGVAAERIHVVPHGIDPGLYRPPPPERRAEIRRRMGIAPEQFVFLNVGAMTDNKGIDELLRAFVEVRRRHPQALLLLKDQRALYQVTGNSLIARTIDRSPQLAQALSREAVKVIPANMNLASLALFYGACDAYVAPYRGEGFGLPPLEAAACGLPIAVTAGGATDDYARESFALKIASRDAEHEGQHYLKVEMDSLIAVMLQLIERRTPGINPALAVPWIAEHFSWARVVDQLLAVFRA